MPRLGYNIPHVHQRGLRPPSRSIRFPRATDTASPDAVPAVLAAPPQLVASVHPANAGQSLPESQGHLSVLPLLRGGARDSDAANVARSARDTAESGDDALKRVSDAELMRVRAETIASSAEAGGRSAYLRARSHSDRKGTRLQSHRLHSSLDSQCPVSHPRLAGNSAMTENLKLLDIVETVINPGESSKSARSVAGSAAAAAAGGGDRAGNAGEGIAGDVCGSDDDSDCEQKMDLADRLEERMRATGQLVKVNTQAQLDTLLPRAPKVLGTSTSGASARQRPTPPSPSPALAAPQADSQGTPSEAASLPGSSPPAPAETIALSDPLPPPPPGDSMPSAAEELAQQGGRRSEEKVLVPAEPAAVFVDQQAPQTGQPAVQQQQQQGGELTTEGALANAKDATKEMEKSREKWIYVWDMHSRLYINRKMPGRFHHSSFVAGGAVKAAGSIVVEDGVLKQLTTWSGHYRPKDSDVAMFLEWLRAKQVDMSDVELLLVKPNKPQSKANQGR